MVGLTRQSAPRCAPAWRRAMAPLVGLMLLAGAACDAPGAVPSDRSEDALAGGRIADNDVWQPAVGPDDPFGPMPEGAVFCEGDALVKPERIDDKVWFDVTTSGCDYWTGSQPLLKELVPGARLLVWVFHFEISAFADAEFELTLAVGDPPRVLWTATEQVPTAASLWYTDALVVDEAMAAQVGEPLWWHLSNHGANTWSLVDLAIGYDGAAPPGSAD